MTNIQLPQITIKRLLDLKVGESEYIIIPIDEVTLWGKRMDWCKSKGLAPANKEIWNKSLLTTSPLQQGDEFYLGERSYPCGNIDLKYEDNSFDNYTYNKCNSLPMYDHELMQADHSRFQGECLNVEIVNISNLTRSEIWNYLVGSKEPSLKNIKEGVSYTKLVAQYNKLHNTNITPSVDDYVFLIEVRRNK